MGEIKAGDDIALKETKSYPLIKIAGEERRIFRAFGRRGHRTLAGTSASTRLLWDELRTVGGDDEAAEGFVLLGRAGSAGLSGT